MHDRSSPIGDFFFSRFSTKHDSVDKLRRLSRADSICSEQSENTKDLIDRVGYVFWDLYWSVIYIYRILDNYKLHSVLLGKTKIPKRVTWFCKRLSTSLSENKPTEGSSSKYSMDSGMYLGKIQYCKSQSLYWINYYIS